MVTIIIYDIKASTPREYARVKRNFYYHLAKVSGFKRINESALLIEKRSTEREVLELFKRHREHIDAYIIKAKSITSVSELFP